MPRNSWPHHRTDVRTESIGFEGFLTVEVSPSKDSLSNPCEKLTEDRGVNINVGNNEYMRRSLARRSLWLIARRQNERTDVLTVGSGDGEFLPIFSFREEVRLFPRLGILEKGWRERDHGRGSYLVALRPLRGRGKGRIGPLTGDRERNANRAGELEPEGFFVQLGRWRQVRACRMESGPDRRRRRPSLRVGL